MDSLDGVLAGFDTYLRLSEDKADRRFPDHAYTIGIQLDVESEAGFEVLSFLFSKGEVRLMRRQCDKDKDGCRGFRARVARMCSRK
jgi:hypothetical protein